MAAQALHFSIPVHWDRGVLEHIYAIWNTVPEAIRPVVTLYGSLPGTPTGRIRDTVPITTLQDAKDYRETARKYGFRFRQLFSAPNMVGNKLAPQAQSNISTLIDQLNPDEICVTQKPLIQYLRKEHPDIKVTLSTIAGVTKPQEIITYADLGVSSICLHHDATRRTPELRDLTAQARNSNVDLEVLATENCVDQCPIRSQHYAVLGRTRPGVAIDDFQIPCWLEKLVHPDEIIAASWIAPQGIDFYRKEVGITHFKVTGRDKKASRLPEIVKAYFTGEYEGNLLRLLGTAPQPIGTPIEPEELFTIVTNELTRSARFHENVDAALRAGVDYKNYCAMLTVILLQSEILKGLDEDAKYDVVDGRVTLVRPGVFFKRAMSYIQGKRALALWTQERKGNFYV